MDSGNQRLQVNRTLIWSLLNGMTIFSPISRERFDHTENIVPSAISA